MSYSIPFKANLAVVLAASCFILIGCGGDPAPAAVEPEISNLAQAPAELEAAPTVVADDRATAAPAAATAAPTGQRIVIAQADSAPAAGRFELGTHYERLPTAQGTSSSPDLIEVAEVFWYGCPHCYTFDPYLENWREGIAEDVNFVRIPAVWNPLLQIHARGFYTAQALGISDELHSPFFREIHVSRNPLNSQEALADFFAANGVSEDDFNAAFESFAVNVNMNRADELSRRYRIASVPTVIVNGKYTTDAGMAGSYEDLMELIDELIAMERAGE